MKSNSLSEKDGSLGITTSNVSTFNKKSRKWGLLERVKVIMKHTNYKVLSCQRAIAQVVIERSGDVARIHGVMSCGSIWLCPVCSQRIAYERCEMIKQASKSGFNMFLVTATLQHKKSDELKVLLKALKQALRKLKQGRWWKSFRERFGVEAYVSSYEINYGFHGWHPHSHILVFVSKEIDIDDFWNRLKVRYVKAIEKVGQYASSFHGLDVKEADENAGSYLTKWSLGSEMTGQFVKSGQSFWDLVEMGKSELCLEYAEATFGLKSLTWSHHAKDILGIKDFTVEKPKDWSTIASVNDGLWRVIRTQALQGVCLQLAILDDSGQALNDYLDKLENSGVNKVQNDTK